MSTTIQLSEKLIEIFNQNAWQSQQLTELSALTSLWRKNKYAISDAALDFVKHFDGFHLNHQAYRSAEVDYSIFDAKKATLEIDASWVFDVYNPKIKSQLVPIGQGYAEHMTYLISREGCFYGAYDDYFCLIGDSVQHFFDNILFNKKFIQL